MDSTGALLKIVMSGSRTTSVSSTAHVTGFLSFCFGAVRLVSWWLHHMVAVHPSPLTFAASCKKSLAGRSAVELMLEKLLCVSHCVGGLGHAKLASRS